MTREEIVKEAQEQVNYCTPLYPECFIQGYLAGAEPRENKMADIKANCDFAIEGRDIKIDELEEKNSQMFNTIALQEQQIEKMKCCENCKYKDCNKTSQYQTCWYCKNKDTWELKE